MGQGHFAECRVVRGPVLLWESGLGAHRTPRLEADLCEVVSRQRRRAGTDSVLAGTRIGPNDGTLSRPVRLFQALADLGPNLQHLLERQRSIEKKTSARPTNLPKFLKALPAEGWAVAPADFRGPNNVVIEGWWLTGIASIVASILR